MEKQLVRFSKFMSLVLRHQPQKYGLILDAHGWAQITDLITAAQRAGVALSRESIQQVVDQNDKQRFAISADGMAIRARQGHSIAVDLALVALEPPEQLYHGTAEQFVASIREHGLLRRSRHHVHLSADIQTASAVGRRHGKLVVLSVASGAMHRDSYQFYRSENGVWLTESVPVAYIGFPEPSSAIAADV